MKILRARSAPPIRLLVTLGLTAAVVLSVAGIAGDWYPASAGVTAGSPGLGARQVRSVEYNLGDTVFRTQDAGPIELAGVVHYPSDLASGTHPLIVQLHGSWFSCADPEGYEESQSEDEETWRRGLKKLGAWPCGPGARPMPSYRGYDYLGKQLARDGFVVVSISANGVNAAEGSNGYQVRADLLNKHLAMWQKLSATGGGELKGAFVDTATRRPANVDFAGHVDLTNVGTMGHSRGGKGIMWQAADVHRSTWPAGVRIKAVLPLAPVYFNVRPDGDPAESLVTDIPIAVITGSCDNSVTFGENYVQDAKGRNTTGIYALAVDGANHNFYNTQWSPESGQIAAEDDARSEGDPTAPAGQCRADESVPPARQLTESEQRRVASTYVPAFFRRHLKGEEQFDPLLTGATKPLSGVTRIAIDAVPPQIG
jgi:hypothetical protein